MTKIFTEYEAQLRSISYTTPSTSKTLCDLANIELSDMTLTVAKIFNSTIESLESCNFSDESQQRTVINHLKTFTRLVIQYVPWFISCAEGKVVGFEEFCYKNPIVEQEKLLATFSAEFLAGNVQINDLDDTTIKIILTGFEIFKISVHFGMMIVGIFDKKYHTVMQVLDLDGVAKEIDQFIDVANNNNQEVSIYLRQPFPVFCINGLLRYLNTDAKIWVSQAKIDYVPMFMTYLAE